MNRPKYAFDGPTYREIVRWTAEGMWDILKRQRSKYVAPENAIGLRIGGHMKIPVIDHRDLTDELFG